MLGGTSTSTMDPGVWYVTVSTNDVTPITLGRMPFAQISGPVPFCGTVVGWADVLELERAQDGTLTRYAASVQSRCAGDSYIHAELRYHSTIGFQAVDIAPMPDIDWPTVIPTIDFGTVEVGTQSVTRTVTITNTGTLPLPVDVVVPPTADFAIEAAACMATTLAAGASCAIDTTFTPSSVGVLTASATIQTPDLGPIERTFTIAGIGGAPTAVTITPLGPPAEETSGEGLYWFAVEVTPPGATGFIELDTVCPSGDKGLRGAWMPWFPQPMYYALDLPPGQCTASIRFDGLNGWGSSTAGPVDFVVPSFSKLIIQSATSEGPGVGLHSRAGLPVAVTATVSGTNGVGPTGGTLSMVNVASGTVLGSTAISADTLSLTVMTDPLAAGQHHLRAVYSGDDTILGVAKDFVLLADGDAPVGTVAIEGNPTAVASPDVTLDLQATDPTTTVVQVRVSDASATAGGVLSTGTTAVATGSMPWLLPGSDGTKHVYAQWRDEVGNWSVPQAASVVLDRDPPSVSGPTWRPGPAGTSFSAAKVPVAVSWTGHDTASGVETYELQQSTDGAPFIASGNAVSTTSTVRYLAPGHSYRFQVRGIDQAGNASAWVSGQTLRLVGIQQSSNAVHFRGTWRRSSSGSWWGGSARYATGAGSTATVTFTGRAIAWISLKAPKRGIAAVFVNGTKVGTVDLRAASLRYRNVVWTKVWATSATRTVTIRVKGTTGRPRVDIDGFIVTR